MTVETAGPGDLPGMLRLMRQLSTEHAGLDAYFEPHEHWLTDVQALFRDRLSRREHFLGVVRDGREVVGMVTATLQPPPVFRLAPRALIENLVVAPHRRRGGLGQLLVDAAVAWCEDQGAVYIEAMVAVDNAAAQQFWAAQRFSPIMVRVRRRTGEASDATG